MDRESLLDLARSLVAELENDDDEAINPNDVSNVAEELGSLAEEVENLQYTEVRRVESDADDIAFRLREQRDLIESWIR